MGNSSSQQENAQPAGCSEITGSTQIKKKHLGSQHITAGISHHPTEKMNSLFQGALPLSEHIPQYIPELISEDDLAFRSPKFKSPQEAAPSTTSIPYQASDLKKSGRKKLWFDKFHEPDRFSFQLASHGPSLCKAFFLYHGDCEEASCPYSHGFEAFGAAATKEDRFIHILRELRRLDGTPNLSNDRLVELLSRRPLNSKKPQIPRIEHLQSAILRHDKNAIVFSPEGPTICREHIGPQGCRADSCGYSHDLTLLRLEERSKEDILKVCKGINSYTVHRHGNGVRNIDPQMTQGQACWDFRDLKLSEIIQVIKHQPINKPLLFKSLNSQEEITEATSLEPSMDKHTVPEAAASTSSTEPKVHEVEEESMNAQVVEKAESITLQTPSIASKTPAVSAALQDPPGSFRSLKVLARSLSFNLHIPGLSGVDILQLISVRLKEKQNFTVTRLAKETKLADEHFLQFINATLKKNEQTAVLKLTNELANAFGEEGLTAADIKHIINQEQIKAAKKEMDRAALDAKLNTTDKEKNKAVLGAKIAPAKKEEKKAVLDAKSKPTKNGGKEWTSGNWRNTSLIASLAKEGKTIGDLSHFVKTAEEDSHDDLAKKFGQLQLHDGTETKSQKPGIASTQAAQDHGEAEDKDSGPEKKAPKKPKIPKGHYANGEVVASSAPEIQADNKGYILLEKHGWSKGEALGAIGAVDRTKNLVPILQKVKIGKEGLR